MKSLLKLPLANAWSLDAFLLESKPGSSHRGCGPQVLLCTLTGAAAVLTIKWAKRLTHHEPSLAKYPFFSPINCSQMSLFSWLCSFSQSIPLHMWVECKSLTFRLQKVGANRTWQIKLPVPCHGTGTLAANTATARVLPWGLSIHAFQFEMFKYDGSHIYRMPPHALMNKTLSCQWAPVSLKPIFFSMRDYSCSYFLAFLLL